MSFQDRAFSAEPPPTTGGPSFAEGEAVDLLHAHGDETSDDPTESAFREKLLDLERRLTDLQDQCNVVRADDGDEAYSELEAELSNAQRLASQADAFLRQWRLDTTSVPVKERSRVSFAMMKSHFGVLQKHSLSDCESRFLRAQQQHSVHKQLGRMSTQGSLSTTAESARSLSGDYTPTGIPRPLSMYDAEIPGGEDSQPADGLVRIHHQVSEANAIFKELASLVMIQQNPVDSLSTALGNARVHMDQAHGELKQTYYDTQYYRRRQAVLLLVLLVLSSLVCYYYVVPLAAGGVTVVSWFNQRLHGFRGRVAPDDA
ncbi:MAG: uncharacterized protein KVP18_002965 [Porospora cf. gigantea A]|uniref:uncharacterized protein n=1 Tax=Porospora cf. gigantea A TaxID=2853593 RepID=UPI00355A9AB4|nr:MAG: hypothetical protein KVP18_002965 [Porospora cf. gigantea A]